ncbi:putative CST complex subunit STN1 isoform X1 [Apostichopus japonicus]|uniref:CST complex subunit STN1 n=1 Tax=Stichopus japonicus TaxID=307972 RepID=A0A2G8K5G7_STIJA|nr:putative CST complex subunit STN1 isoform X1 [Apostichopus japonicus]
MGIIVKAEEKAKFHIYAVDDGTGVISCVCWKPKEDFNLRSNGEDGAQSLIKRMENWHLEQLSCLEIGDLVNIRGKLNIYREMKQISAFSYGKVVDPSHTLEVRGMQDQVLRYTSVYDNPLKSTEHSGIKDQGTEGIKSMEGISQEVAEKILLVSTREKYQNFHLYELETVPDIYKVCCQPCEEFINGKGNEEKSPPSEQIALALKNGVKHLLEKGHIFKSKRDRGLLHLTTANKDLRDVTCRILRAECRKQEYINGCQFQHLYNNIKTRTDFQYLTHSAMRNLLNSLEEQGFVISCNNYQFLPVR